MSFLRVLFRLPALFVFSGTIALLHSLTRLVCLGHGPREMRARSFWMRLWGRTGLRILGAELEIDGEAPPAPYLLVSNHLSYIDILVLSAGLPAAHFISRSDVADWPLIGPVATAGQTIYIDRERWRDLPQVVAQIRSILERGGGVAFFPEATTSGGSGLLPFRGALFEAPVRTGFDVFCASISYETRPGEPAASETICWWRDMEFMPHLRGMAALSGFRARLRFSPNACSGADRKELAARCRSEIEEIFQPSTQADDDMGDFEEHVGLNRSLLGELRELLASMSAERYTRRLPELRSEGIGVHVRHALDFYATLLDQQDSGTVDYDARAREEELELLPEAAVARIDRYLEQLATLDADRALRVGHDARGEQRSFSDSSLQRELRFVASHTVHHAAIVAMLLRLDGQSVDGGFGIAPSTLEHMKRLGLGTP